MFCELNRALDRVPLSAKLNKESKLKINRNICIAIVCVRVVLAPVAQAQERPDSTLQTIKTTKTKAKAKAEQPKPRRKKNKRKPRDCAEKIAANHFWKRLDEALLEQLGTPAYTPPEPNAAEHRGAFRRRHSIRHHFHRAIGKSAAAPIIGDPGELAPYPLMQAIYEGPGGEAWKKSKVQIYGWVNFSGNISTSHPSKTSENGNFPLIYDLRPNRMELNQIVLYLERLPDENQTDHIDWGFRMSALYGLDYRFTDFARMVQRSTVKAQQLLRLRHADGLFRSLHSVRFPGNEYSRSAESFPSRTSKRSSLRTISWPPTRSSTASMIIATKEFSRPRRSTINGRFRPAIDTGTDVAIWQDDPGRQVTGTVMIQWTAPNQMDSIYAGANNFNNGKFGYNNLQQYRRDLDAQV